MSVVPVGFNPHFRKSAVTDPWEPLFSRRGEHSCEIGFVIGPQHCNSRGFLHGGVMAALADNAMGLSCVAAMGPDAVGVVTVSLAIDYVGGAPLGAWALIAPRVLKPKGAILFADALITADEVLIARANASFRVPPARSAP